MNSYFNLTRHAFQRILFSAKFLNFPFTTTTKQKTLIITAARREQLQRKLAPRFVKAAFCIKSQSKQINVRARFNDGVRNVPNINILIILIINVVKRSNRHRPHCSATINLETLLSFHVSIKINKQVCRKEIKISRRSSSFK